MPPRDYSKGVIYKICCRDPSITECYVGSTIDLIRRRAEHKRFCNSESDKKRHLHVYQYIRENGGWDNWEVVPIEQFPAESKAQLEIRERHWLEQLGATLNSRKPAGIALAGSKEEYYRQQSLQYYTDNREAIREKQRQYWADNRESMLEKDSQYYTDNREVILERKRHYYKDNREAIAERRKERLTCECGAIVSKSSLIQHRRSAKHQKLLAENNAPTE